MIVGKAVHRVGWGTPFCCKPKISLKNKVCKKIKIKIKSVKIVPLAHFSLVSYLRDNHLSLNSCLSYAYIIVYLYTCLSA